MGIAAPSYSSDPAKLNPKERGRLIPIEPRHILTRAVLPWRYNGAEESARTINSISSDRP